MPGKLPLSALGIMLFCNVAWAMNVVVSKIAVTTLGLPPLFYTVLRSATVLAVLFPLLRFVPQRPLLVLVIGFAITGGSFGLQFIGLQTASPSAVAASPGLPRWSWSFSAWKVETCVFWPSEPTRMIWKSIPMGRWQHGPRWAPN
jgi:hypothetical protein